MIPTPRLACPATLLAVPLLAFSMGCAPDAPPERVAELPEARVLVIGIDGVRPDVLAEVATPNLDRLIREGAYTAQARTGLPTVSGPGWSSMLIGVWPEKHGVHSNDFTGNAYDRYPDFLTRLEGWRPELETVALADWLPLVAEDSGGPLMGEGPDRKHVVNGYDVGWREGDSILTEEAVRELSEGDPDALFLYLGDPDETSHRTGSIGRSTGRPSPRRTGRWGASWPRWRPAPASGRRTGWF